MKQKNVAYLLGAFAILLVIVLNFFGVFQTLEYKSYDYRIRNRMANIISDKIVIAAIDENSLEHLGRWPWDRSIQARMIQKLTRAGAKTIGVDILFIEKSNEQSDTALEEAVKESKRCVNELLFEIDRGIPKKQKLPISGIAKYSIGIGFPNVFPEIDGVVRKVKPTIEYQKKLYPHVSVSIASAYMEKPIEELLNNVPLDDNGEMLINYAGGFETFKYISYYDILEGKINDEVLKDKIVLIGYAAAGLGDRHVTPVSPVMPGIETIANNVNAFINSDFISYSSGLFGFLTIIVIGGILAFFLPKLSSWKSTFLVITVFVIWFLISRYYFVEKKVWVEYVPVTFLIFFSYLSITSWRFITEEKEKRWLKKAFGQYLSPLVINEIMKNPDALALGGKRQEMTVLFSDIRGFTTISEALTPEGVVTILNEYLTKMTEIVFKYEGTLDKFIGDAVMAFWNAPIPQNDHTQRAVYCAIEMIEELKKLQEKWRAENKPIMDIGIGINRGDMVVGNMGSIERMDYTVIGDNVNLASRLEGLNKEFRTHIILSESAYQVIKDTVLTKPLGTTKVKGKEKLVQIYSVEGKV
ncbi:MAG: hypothetical protein A2551_04950 [Elusimicrobia bacterium RIFOXYD2_FULL_34_30]|nr:MAG: hypothetical protein A2551_04950 [Elusimicrobia bacterium RIFOXYD2_FULL_34_30]